MPKQKNSKFLVDPNIDYEKQMPEMGSMVDVLKEGIHGAVTHYQVAMGKGRYVGVQREGIDPETDHPYDVKFYPPEQVKGKFVDIDSDFPFSAIGSNATERVSGYSGYVESIIIMKTGCLHAILKKPVTAGKPRKKNPKTDKDGINVNFNDLIGDEIPKLTKKELAAKKEEKPGGDQNFFQR